METFPMRGTIHEIWPVDQKTDKFRKQEFILEVANNKQGGTYKEFIKFQCINDKTALMNSVEKKDVVSLKFEVSGRKYEKDGNVSYFTNLTVIDLAVISSRSSGPTEIKANDGQDYSDILPGLSDGSVDLSGIGGEEKKEIPYKPDDLPF